MTKSEGTAPPPRLAKASNTSLSSCMNVTLKHIGFALRCIFPVESLLVSAWNAGRAQRCGPRESYIGRRWTLCHFSPVPQITEFSSRWLKLATAKTIIICNGRVNVCNIAKFGDCFCIEQNKERRVGFIMQTLRNVLTSSCEKFPFWLNRWYSELFFGRLWVFWQNGVDWLLP